MNKSFGNSRVYCYQVGYHDTNDSKGYDMNNTTIWKNKLHWYFNCASSRRIEVFMNYKTLEMPSSLYPFAGFG